ncbi:MAG: proline dehydrogenase family protein [Rubripirellula sp.]
MRDAVEALLGNFTHDPHSDLEIVIQKALLVARRLQTRANELQTPEERKQQTELDRMIQNPSDKVTLTALTDQAFRSHEAARSADQLVHILDAQGVPRFFSPLERSLLMGFQSFGSYLPGVTIPMVKEKMRRETANVIIPAENKVLRQHLTHRREEGVRMNVNFLGEAILGAKEAQRRLRQILQALQLPEIEVVSVKLSTIYSQTSSLAMQHMISELCERLGLLFRAAHKGRFVRSDGTEVRKFVYLDMEEYRDLSLTAEAFMRTLETLQMRKIRAGIVFQAYIPDSFLWQQRVSDWARDRWADGGAPTTMRIVKGANMEMERVEASLHGWPQAPYLSKPETDANYKRMVKYAFTNSMPLSGCTGIASHNLFDISYGLVMAAEYGAFDRVQFEMLEGMANHQRRALHELTRNLLLYAPACDKSDFIHAIGYLVRRLDENTGEDNFLRHAFNIKVDSESWKKLENGFLESFDLIDGLSSDPRRQQDRNSETFAVQDPSPWTEFVNEPDTDFSLPQNSTWANEIISRWDSRCEQGIEVPLFVAGVNVEDDREVRDCWDPSRDLAFGKYRQANQDDAQRAVDCAKQDPDGWRTMEPSERHRRMREVAAELRRSRGELMGAALAEAGKTLAESDPEVSEAVDFVEFYSATAQYFESYPNVRATPRGVVVVVSPWNFPIAIPCGGIAAALASGNTVILKPASNAVLVAHQLCECFYRAGVPRTALQLLPCSGGDVGSQLVAHPKVDTVILTGGTDTALRMLKSKPEMHLLAETGGKNVTIVTALSDRDQAIKHVIQSAFSHGGQKCSATSLLLLEQEVFEDVKFKNALVDAVSSLHVGSAWKTENRIGPLIRPPTGDLDKGLKELELGESWALMPQKGKESPAIYSPGIKWNVQRGSYTHLTEFFGPVLGVMPYRTMREAIAIVNETGYGLTSGLESLDDREQQEWLAGVRAGNMYVNRSTTGAIVLRQPFGGMGKSAFGPGIKAGGPNYVTQLMQFEPTEPAASDAAVKDVMLAELLEGAKSGEQEDFGNLLAATIDYERAAEEEFLQSHDHFQLVGQDNLRRYLPVTSLCIRVTEADSWFEIVARAVAAKTVGCRSIISAAPGVHEGWLQTLHDLTETWAGNIEFVQQTDQELCEVIEWAGFDRLRYACPDRVPLAVRQAVIGRYAHIADGPVLGIGRIELLNYLKEQSISSDYHRYGNLGDRKPNP